VFLLTEEMALLKAEWRKQIHVAEPKIWNVVALVVSPRIKTESNRMQVIIIKSLKLKKIYLSMHCNLL